jgi:hypothetical protein
MFFGVAVAWVAAGVGAVVDPAVAAERELAEADQEPEAVVQESAAEDAPAADDLRAEACLRWRARLDRKAGRAPLDRAAAIGPAAAIMQ